MISKSVGAVGVAVFMIGVATGYALSGTAPAPEAARFKVKPATQHVSVNGGVQEPTQHLPMIVALDAMAPGAIWAPLTGDGSN